MNSSAGLVSHERGTPVGFRVNLMAALGRGRVRVERFQVGQRVWYHQLVARLHLG